MSDEAVALESVALAMTPDAMRAFARFVAHAASEMERLGDDYDHLHYQDCSDAFQDGWPDVQLTKVYD